LKEIPRQKRKLLVAYFGKIVALSPTRFYKFKRLQVDVYLLFMIVFKTISLNLPQL
jgi:hypothetical protein